MTSDDDERQVLQAGSTTREATAAATYLCEISVCDAIHGTAALAWPDDNDQSIPSIHARYLPVGHEGELRASHCTIATCGLPRRGLEAQHGSPRSACAVLRCAARLRVCVSVRPSVGPLCPPQGLFLFFWSHVWLQLMRLTQHCFGWEPTVGGSSRPHDQRWLRI